MTVKIFQKVPPADPFRLKSIWMHDYEKDKEVTQKYAHLPLKLRIGITWVIEREAFGRIIHILGLLILAVGIAAPHMRFDNNHNCSCSNCYSNIYFAMFDHWNK